MADGGKKILFIDLNVHGKSGLFEQDFLPDLNTSSTRKTILGFDSGFQPETFVVSPDGSHITFSSIETENSLMIAEKLPGIR